MAVKALAPNIDKAVRAIIAQAGEAGKLYQANTHRSAVALIAVQALIAEGHLKKEEGADAMMVVYTAFNQESSLLEHSNFKQSRLMANDIVPKPVDKPKASGIVAVEFE